mgnify:CR=1 FL=1
MVSATSPILLVEDDPSLRDSLGQFLHDHGYRTVVARTAREGREMLGTARPWLCLLDLNLPKKDGREVLAEIKADDELKRIPVVVLTTSRAEQDIVRSYNLHANCYITKPVDIEQFITIVKSIETFWFEVVVLAGE